MYKLGTLKYFAPEKFQFVATSEDFKNGPADVFALGCVFLELATTQVGPVIKILCCYC